MTSDAAVKCRACGASLAAPGERCPRCSTPQAESARCPHCRAIADVVPSGALGPRCAICAAPRLVDLDATLAAPDALDRLREAGRAHVASLAWTTAGTLAGAFGLLSSLVVAPIVVLAHPPPAATAAAAVATFVPFCFAALTLGRGLGARRTRDGALDAARLAVARASRLGAEALASALGVSLATAVDLEARAGSAGAGAP